MKNTSLSVRRAPVLRAAAFVVRLLLGGLFVVAGVLKFLDPAEFATEIQRYQLIPWAMGALTAVYLPWLEMLAGALLLMKKMTCASLCVMTLLLIIFSAALGNALARGLNIDCGCFGKAFAATGTILPLCRNAVLLASTGFLWWWESGASKETLSPTRDPHSADTLSASQ